MAAKKSPIQDWLDSKGRDYQEGVKLYAAHPTAMRGLVNTLQRKENDYTREKLVYVMEKAAQADAEGTSKKLKKKGKRQKGGKSAVRSPQSAAKPKAVKGEIPKKPTLEKEMPEIPAKKEGPPTKPHEEEE